jgi:hypothetical protein
MCWICVFLLPMAHLNTSLAIAVCSRPLQLKVESSREVDGGSKVPCSIVRDTQLDCAGGVRFLFSKTIGVPNIVLNSLVVVGAVAAIPYIISPSALLAPSGAVLYVPPFSHFIFVTSCAVT